MGVVACKFVSKENVPGTVQHIPGAVPFAFIVTGSLDELIPGIGEVGLGGQGIIPVILETLNLPAVGIVNIF